MPKRPFFLITGDDSVRAPGIILLKRIVEPFADFAIVATKTQQSAKGSGLTFPGGTWGKELIDGHESIWVDGTPSDAVFFAFDYLKKKPDLVLSGVNLGINVSDTMHRSGTVAAALTATQARSTPSVVFSLDSEMSKWFADHNGNGFSLDLLDYPGKLIHLIIKKALTYKFPAGSFWNVNFPAKKTKQLKIIHTSQTNYWKNNQNITAGTFVYTTDHKSTDELPNCDSKLVNQGFATITPCKISFTLHSEMPNLKKIFANI